MTNHQDHRRRILEEIAGGNLASQRSLARQLRIALGLANSLIRSLSEEKLIRASKRRGRGARYVLTRKGRDEQLRLSREYLATIVDAYTRARERIHRRLSELSIRSTGDRGDRGGATARVVFFGAGDLAEIASACAPAANLELVGVVDDVATTAFWGRPVHRSNQLTATSLNDEPFDFLLIVSTRPTEEIEHRLKEIGFPKSRTAWL